MATVEIKQGDSFAIFIDLDQDGDALTPAMIEELEICVGEGGLRFTFLDGSVGYDNESGLWYIWPTQEQTFSMEEGSHAVEVRPKYKNQNTTNVKGYKLGDKIKVSSSLSREVL